MVFDVIFDFNIERCIFIFFCKWCLEFCEIFFFVVFVFGCFIGDDLVFVFGNDEDVFFILKNRNEEEVVLRK